MKKNKKKKESRKANKPKISSKVAEKQALLLSSNGKKTNK